MKKLLYLIHLLTVVACHSDSTGLKVTEKRFAGYKQLNQEKDIPQLRPAAETSHTVKINSSDIKEFIDVEDLIENITYLKLETSKESLIGTVDNIYFIADKIIIVDKDLAQSVFVFDNKGKFETRIHHPGKGPGEFIELSDVSIDYSNKLIVIYDMQSNRINFFGLDGKFKGYKKTFFYFGSLKILEDDIYVMECYTPNLHLRDASYSYLLYSSPEGQVKGHSFPYPSGQIKFREWGSFKLRECDNNVYYTPRFSDRIFQISNGRVTEKYFFDFCGKAIDQSSYSRVTSQADFNQIMRNDPRYFNGNFSETNNTLYFNFREGEKSWIIAFYSKKSRRLIASGTIKTSGLIPFFNYPITSHNDMFVSYISASNIKNGKSLDKSSPQYELITKSRENDNPVLMFYRIKEF